jgi:hypothetical protein
MTADEYYSLERCPMCGQSFTKFRYGAAVFLGIVLTAITWLSYWDKPTQVSLVGSTVITCFGLGFATLIVTIDQLLLRTTHFNRRTRRRLGNWLTVGILLVVAYLTKDYVISLTQR